MLEIFFFFFYQKIFIVLPINGVDYAVFYPAVPDLSKFHFDVHSFPLNFEHVKYIWVHVRAQEVFERVKLLLASLYPTLD